MKYMHGYPIERRARVEKRQAIRDELSRDAAAEAERRGRSWNCTQVGEFARHAGMPDGCANDGTGCLCLCHDPADPGVEGHPIGGRNGGAA